MQNQYVNIENRIFLPEATQAVLWDLDGTLVDSFTFDLKVCSKIISQYAGRQLTISEQLLREGFPLAGMDFWHFLFEGVGLRADENLTSQAFRDWIALRLVEPFPLHEGIAEILPAIRKHGLRMAVVSNNPQSEVIQIAQNSGILSWFDLLVGNDGEGRAKKPEPDSYIYAAEMLGVPVEQCVVIEDSVLGLKSGKAAQAYTIGVASGAEAFDQLVASSLADVCFSKFHPCVCGAIEGEASEVTLPDNAVALLLKSALGCSDKAIRIIWNNNNWPLLANYIEQSVQSSR